MSAATEGPPRADPNIVQSVLRAAALLECFADGREQQSLSELARATGLTVSTTHRLLRTLSQSGLLWHDGTTERYLPGPALVRLARAVLDRGDLAGTRELLAALTLQARLPVSLAVRRGDAVVTVLRARLDGVVEAGADAPPRQPLHACAPGKVLLAYGDRPVAEAVAALGPLAAVTPATLVAPAELAADLERARTRAYAVEDGEAAGDRRGVAVPVRGPNGEVVAALGVAGTGDELPVDAAPRLGRVLAAAAGAIAVPTSLASLL